MKKKKKKVNKRKFLSRIFFLIIIVVIIVVIAKKSGNKEKEDVSSTIFVNNVDVTRELEGKPYINKDNVLYLSIENISKTLDKNIYYEEETRKIITTSGTKVAAIDVDNNIVQVNSANIILSAGVLNYGTSFEIPVSELTNIYNIEAFTTENTAILSSMHEELVTVKTTAKTSLKEKTNGFSKTIQKLEEGTEVIYVGEAENKSWSKVLTYEGKMGYIKNKKITDKEYKRVKMEDDDFSSSTGDISQAIEINSSKLTYEKLNNFNVRKELIEGIISKAIDDNKFTFNINLQNVNIESKYLERFIIEFIPRIRGIGGKVMLTNNSSLSSAFLEENKL